MQQVTQINLLQRNLCSQTLMKNNNAAFLRSRESHLDIEIVEHEAPHDAEEPVPDSPCANIQREEHDSPDDVLDSVDTVEPMKPSERLRDAPHAKRRPTWLRETLQEAEKHTAPFDRFRESRRP